jgi:2-polyprenyl-6-methoxyphenol hydroxylase-like FAD-dependent oxidoreductase
VLIATPERLGVPDDRLFRLSGAELHELVNAAVTSWHPVVRDIFARADPDAFFPITIRAGQRIEPWESGNVTLLGDAVHAMPPAGGVGANTALWDAALLTREITRGASLLGAVSRYEKEMIPHGFDTVESSVRQAGQMFGART